MKAWQQFSGTTGTVGTGLGRKGGGRGGEGERGGGREGGGGRRGQRYKPKKAGPASSIDLRGTWCVTGFCTITTWKPLHLRLIPKNAIQPNPKVAHNTSEARGNHETFASRNRGCNHLSPARETIGMRQLPRAPCNSRDQQMMHVVGRSQRHMNMRSTVTLTTIQMHR